MTKFTTATIAVLLVAPVALLVEAQTSGTVHMPSGVSYEFRYITNDPRTTEVCLHEVDAAGALVDRNSSGTVDRGDAFACSTALVADGATVNRLTHTFSPPLSAGVKVALRDYDGVDILPSGPSNWHQLVVQLVPSTLLD